MSAENNYIEDYSDTWADLANFCIYWEDSIKKIPNIQKFFEENDGIRDDSKFYNSTYYIIFRTTYTYDYIASFVYTMFSKIFSMDIVELSWDEINFYNSNPEKPSTELMAYSVKFDVIRPNLWNPNNLSKMVFYSLCLLELLDYRYCPYDKRGMSSLSDILYDLLHMRYSTIETYKDEFFHVGLSELITTLRNLQGKDKSHNWRLLRDGPRFISIDCSAITSVLQSRHDINDAISRIDGYNPTQITDEILKQYETMRRNF